MNKTTSLEKHSSREERMSSLSEGEWAVAESQRGITQDEVKSVCQGATPWKTSIFLRGKVELFIGRWVSCYWIPKRDNKEGWRRMKWKLYYEVQRPEKRVSSLEEGLSSSPEGEWAVAKSQRGMAKVKWN